MGRFISDNVLVAFKILHYVKCKRRGKNEEVTLKMDISKAYDNVTWTYLENVMLRVCFAQRWVGTVMLCVCTVRYSIAIYNSFDLVPFVLNVVYIKGIPCPHTYLFYALNVCLPCSQILRLQESCMVAILASPILVLLTYCL